MRFPVIAKIEYVVADTEESQIPLRLNEQTGIHHDFSSK